MEFAIPYGLDWLFFIVGLAFVLFTPIGEYFMGDVGAKTFLLAGYVCLILSMILTLSVFGYSLLYILALLAIAWNLFSYGVYVFRSNDKIVKRGKILEHCEPKLIHGDEMSFADYRWSIRTKLLVAFDVQPTDCQLVVSLWAVGRAFYGFYFTSQKLLLEPGVQISCTRTKEGKCRPLAEISASSYRQESPLTVMVKHEITEKDDEITVRIMMYASVGAIGGGAGFSAAGAGGSVSLPSAGTIFQQNMGTYRWRCDP